MLSIKRFGIVFLIFTIFGIFALQDISLAEEYKLSNDVLGKINYIVNRPSLYTDKDRKTKEERIQDMTDYYKKTGSILWQYDCVGMDIKGAKIEDYLFDKDILHINKDKYKLSKYKNLENKMEFAQFMSEVCPEAVPKTFFNIKNGKVISEGEFEGVDFVSAFNSLKDGKYFLKVVDESQGKNIFLMEKNGAELTFNNGEIALEQIEEKLNTGKTFILQERIVNHEDIAKFCPNVANTVRIVTTRFNDHTGILGATLRMGSNMQTVVDNAAAGGVFVGIDELSGELKKYEYSEKRRTVATINNLSGIEYEGYKLPYWKETIDLVKKLHAYCDQYYTIGWDVVITEDGPKVLELNLYPDLNLIQLPHGGLKEKYESLKHFDGN